MNNMTSSSSQPTIWSEALFGLDWLALHLSPVYAGLGVTRGDGSPVILVPGLLASDACFEELYAWLERVGYRPYFSGIGLNARCPEASVSMLLETIDRVYRETGRELTLVGHSLGGLVARGVALRRPGKVARVITLGSPAWGIRAHPAVMAIAQALHGSCSGDCLVALQEPLPPSVTEACIYSKDDAVVDPQTCVRGDASANVEVRGTHLGLIVNAQVYQAIAALLAVPVARSEIGWRPLERVATPVVAVSHQPEARTLVRAA